MKKISILATLIATFFVAVLISGCTLTKKADDTKTKTTEQTNNAVADINSDEDTIEMPTTDAFGEDLADIPRYTGSIRSYYSQDEEETDITYDTTDTEAQVREFYKTTLTAKGWRQTGIATDYIDFEKGDEANPEILTVYFTQYGTVLEYELVYSPPLTPEELAAENEE